MRHTREPSQPGLALDTGKGAHGVEQILALGRILDVSVDEKGVHFGVNALHHNLETIEVTSFGCLSDLVGESLDQTLIDATTEKASM